MIMAYMEVQCFEMCVKVKIEKLLIFFCVDEWVSPCLFGCYAF